jgi:hypothetical protein
VRSCNKMVHPNGEIKSSDVALKTLDRNGPRDVNGINGQPTTSEAIIDYTKYFSQAASWRRYSFPRVLGETTSATKKSSYIHFQWFINCHQRYTLSITSIYFHACFEIL